MSENNHTKSGRGGTRKGAGRKTGSATKITRDIVDKAVEEGITPREVMLAAMRRFYHHGDLPGAANIAKYAAPYVQPRLTAIDHTSNGKDMTQSFGVLMVPKAITEEEWERMATPDPVLPFHLKEKELDGQG